MGCDIIKILSMYYCLYRVVCLQVKLVILTLQVNSTVFFLWGKHVKCLEKV